MHKIFNKTGTASILIYLLTVKEKPNQKQIVANTDANPMTISSALEILEHAGLVSSEKGNLFNQSFFSLTPKGRRVAELFQQIQRLPSTFAIADLERAGPSVSRDMIRVVLNRLRKEGRLLCKGTGRNARWEKRGNDQPKRGNKRGNTG